MDNFNNEQKHLKLGNIYRDSGRNDLALKEFESIIKIDPQNEAAWLELGKTYKMMNRCPDAIEKFIQAVRINPNNKEALMELGGTSRISNNCERAMKEFKEVIGRTLNNEYAHIELSKIYQKIGSFDLALEELRKAYAINQYNSEIFVGFGQVYKAKGQNEEAIGKFKEALKIDPDNKNAHVELGKIYQGQKNYEAAIKEFKSAIRIDPSDKQLHLNLVQLYTKQNEYDSSNKEAQVLLQLIPNDQFSQDAMLNEIEIFQGKTILRSKVKRLWVTLTTRCNIRCRTCGLWSSPWEIPRKTVDEVIELFPYLERVVWLGGEVFLYKFFEELFQKANVFPHLQQQIITNGVILTEEWIKKIVEAGAELTISVDGVTKDVYEYIRTGASFEKLIKNIKLAQDLIQKYHSETKMRLNAVIMKSNYHQLEEFLDFANEFGFEQVSLMALHFDEDPEENIFYSKKDFRSLEYITNTVPKIRQKAKAYDIDLDILLPTEDLKFDRFENNNYPAQPQQETLHCKMPWKYMFICDKGTVYLTGSCLKSIGNIYNNSLDEIWNGPEAQIYRESLLKNQFQDLCRPECMTRWEI